ncbi:LPXTG-motif cell wall anchor domain-containing protein/fimbrial isopeptide formation D2 domain-containing protein [Ruminococcus sp. YRD2003]|uniref:isopeptide-forming domain-containing fimbrial protein n=1 Tax=Ruminococcus sp. YRD2003 TaxID=1452313 RepID=UPI0008D0CA37|nr:LPXTG-motif cell wall anchor domain-containing protein/fimbrial isopeptide formation D2 domain-containing protein [Ruminococcus flavefaciens]
MKKTLKGLSAILMTSVLAVSASAATVGSLTASAGSIKVKTAADTNNAYKAYPILTGTLTEGKLSNVDFSDALPTTTDSSGKKHLSDDLVSALKTKSGLTAFASLSTDTTPTQFADMIANLADKSADAEKFAKIIGRYVASSEAIAISTDATPVADGYYIVKEEGTGAPKTLNLLKVAGNAAIDVKETTPSSDKTVTDVNDSKNVADTHTKTADYDIGDNVPYVLTFTLPSDYSRYEKYPITFTDTMSAGLSFDKSAEIFYGTGDTTGDAITFSGPTAVTGGNQYTYQVDLKALQATEAAKTAADQDEDIMGISKGTVIRIEYTATLNDNAVIGGTGNPNTYTVEYANDPNWVPSDDTPGTPETPPENPPTGTTPESKNVVFTYQLTVNKKDDDGNSLNGATFKLSKWTDKEKAADINGTSWKQVDVIQLTDAATFDFKGLDDGIYKLEETAAPAHYNPIAPIKFEITAEHIDSTYTLDTIQTDLTDATVTNGVISVDIKNNKGIQLPSTGGMGTTIFYIVGGLMISGALVLLIVKKRMSIKEK